MDPNNNKMEILTRMNYQNNLKKSARKRTIKIVPFSEYTMLDIHTHTTILFVWGYVAMVTAREAVDEYYGVDTFRG